MTGVLRTVEAVYEDGVLRPEGAFQTFGKPDLTGL